MKLFHRSHLMLFLAAATAAGFLINSLHAAARPSAAASTTEEQAVMAPITAMFDGMAKRDAAAIKTPLLPGGSMVLMRDGKPTQLTFDAFAEAVGKLGKAQIEERIHDPLVRIDNDLAVVWAPFEFLVDGTSIATTRVPPYRVQLRWLSAIPRAAVIEVRAFSPDGRFSSYASPTHLNSDLGPCVIPAD